MGRLVELRPVQWEVDQEALRELNEISQLQGECLREARRCLNNRRKLRKRAEELSKRIRTSLLGKGRVEPGVRAVEIVDGELRLSVACAAVAACGD